MPRVLAAQVALVDSDTFESTIYRKGTTPPPEVADRITNPSAWVEAEPAPEPAPPAPAAVDPADDEGGDPGDGTSQPAGNASTEAWRAYAEHLGVVDIAADAKREQIKAELEGRGLLS